MKLGEIVPGGGVVLQDFGGDPADIHLSGQELTQVGHRLQRQSRASALHGSQAVQNWLGSASVAYATCNGQHVRGTAAASTKAQRAGTVSQSFATQLRRIQREGAAAVRERTRLTRELDAALRQRSAEVVGPGRDLGAEEDILDLRRRITAQTRILERLDGELGRVRKKFGDDLLDLVPATMVAWYYTAQTGHETYKNVKTIRKAPATVRRVATAARALRAASRSRDPAKIEAARKELVAARRALTSLPAGAKQLDQVHKASNSKMARKLLEKEPVKRRAERSRVLKVANNPAVRRVLGPVGVVTTVYGGGKDAVTGGGKDGAQGVATRTSGVLVAGGTGLMMTTAGAPLGAVLVVTGLSIKASMWLWDRAQGGSGRPVQRSPERIRRLRALHNSRSGTIAISSESKPRKINTEHTRRGNR
ncbi:hypothetical protein [Demetria terragena]|uniref:hypothetical protein n=1 Tax=Demetria terragena TaxID=63959 RepID=UPI00036EB898|nr:hypothetical protein [Demetria terragena]